VSLQVGGLGALSIMPVENAYQTFVLCVIVVTVKFGLGKRSAIYP